MKNITLLLTLVVWILICTSGGQKTKTDPDGKTHNSVLQSALINYTIKN